MNRLTAAGLAGAFLVGLFPLQSAASSNLHFRRALEFRFKGQTDAAIREYQRGLAADPTSVQGHDQYGALLLDERGDVDGAISEFMTALGLDPSCVSCKLHLNDALDKKNSTSSEEILNGNHLYSSGQLSRAAAAYRVAIHIKPDDPVAHNSLAWTLYRLGELDEGMDEIKTALKLRPDDPEFINTLACLYYEQGQLNDAIATWKKAIEKSKKPGAADLYGLAVGMLDKGDEKKAGEYFREAIEADPKYKDLSYVSNRVGMSVKAVSYHDRLLKLAGLNGKK